MNEKEFVIHERRHRDIVYHIDDGTMGHECNGTPYWIYFDNRVSQWMKTQIILKDKKKFPTQKKIYRKDISIYRRRYKKKVNAVEILRVWAGCSQRERERKGDSFV